MSVEFVSTLYWCLIQLEILINQNIVISDLNAISQLMECGENGATHTWYFFVFHSIILLESSYIFDFFWKINDSFPASHERDFLFIRRYKHPFNHVFFFHKRPFIHLTTAIVMTAVTADVATGTASLLSLSQCYNVKQYRNT